MNRFVAVMICVTILFSSIPSGHLNSQCESVSQQTNEESIISLREIHSALETNSSKVKLEVKYPVGYKPPVTFYYTRTNENGVKYGGTLTLDTIRIRDDATYALYIGYLAPIE
jgi:hypothetical protein